MPFRSFGIVRAVTAIMQTNKDGSEMLFVNLQIKDNGAPKSINNSQGVLIPAESVCQTVIMPSPLTMSAVSIVVVIIIAIKIINANVIA